MNKITDEVDFTYIDDWYESPLGKAYFQEARDNLENLLRSHALDGSNPHVLEIGPGSGKHTQLLLNKGFHVTAVEPSKNLFQKLSEIRNPRLVAINSTIEELSLNKKFDGIVSCNALEFVSSRETAFSQISSFLKPNGWALIGVCNRWSLWGLAHSFFRLIHKGPYYQGTFYSKHELQELFEKSEMTAQAWRFCIFFPPINYSFSIKMFQKIFQPLYSFNSMGGGCIMSLGVKRKCVIDHEIHSPMMGPPA